MLLVALMVFIVLIPFFSSNEESVLRPSARQKAAALRHHLCDCVRCFSFRSANASVVKQNDLMLRPPRGCSLLPGPTRSMLELK